MRKKNAPRSTGKNLTNLCFFLIAFGGWRRGGWGREARDVRCLQPSVVSASEEEGRRGERTTAERQENGRNTASIHMLIMKRPGERQVNLPGLN